MGTCQGKLASVNEALNVSARGVITNLSNIYIYIFFLLDMYILCKFVKLKREIGCKFSPRRDRVSFEIG